MTAQTRFPEWIRRKWASGQDFGFTKDLLEGLALHTVCQSANCPNQAECWGRRTATIMVLGSICTRSCRYCSVAAGKPEPPDADEPYRVAQAIRAMGLKHVVVTSVTRDDLPDDGAGHIAETIRAIHDINPGVTVEILTPDFRGKQECIETVLTAEPEVFSHNIETVERLYPVIRSRRYSYRLALGVLRMAAAGEPRPIIKSALMVGHGETEAEVERALGDLLDAGCQAVAIGQYLRPTKKQREVVEFIHPDQFKAYEAMAYAMGFAFAVAGPFVRSSYRSEELMQASFVRDYFVARRARPLVGAAG